MVGVKFLCLATCNDESHDCHVTSPVLICTQERQREMTLKRRRSRLQLEASASGVTTPSARNSMDFPENAEFDELISSLKTGDYFARRRSRMNSGLASRRLEYSRDRPASAIELDSQPESEET